MGFPAGKDEDEAMAEFLEEPLVSCACRTEACEGRAPFPRPPSGRYRSAAAVVTLAV
jgi:hypothetical protein